MSGDDDSSSSLSSEMSEDSVFGADTFPSETSHCFQNTPRSRQPVSLRGRVHIYPCNTSHNHKNPRSSKAIGFEGMEVSVVQQRAVLDKTDEFYRESVGGGCESIRAKLTPPRTDNLGIRTRGEGVLVQKACLVQNSVGVMSAPRPPIDCCSDSDTDLSPIIVAAPLTSYSIDRDQLFPGAVFDSHCHLDFVYRRLKGEGLRSVHSLNHCLVIDGEDLGTSFGGCVANFCNPTDWGQGRSGRLVSKDIENSMRDRRVFLTIGCHPHYADRMHGNRTDQLAMLVSGRSQYLPRKVVALGECGLDYSRKNTINKDLQKKVFTDQLKIAMQFKLPLVLHIRDAEADGYEVLEAAGVPKDWPIHRHCFTDGWEEASLWLKRYPASKIGITGIVTYQGIFTNGVRKVKEVVRNIPLDRILLETDAPYFLPAKVNRSSYPWSCSLPGHVVHVAAQVAAIKEVSLRTVLEQNLMNVHDVYKVGRVGGDGAEIKNKVETLRAKMK